MDISNIASVASNMAATNLQMVVGIAVQRKAMDIQASSAAALLAALPPVTSANLPAHLGQNINTTA